MEAARTAVRPSSNGVEVVLHPHAPQPRPCRKRGSQLAGGAWMFPGPAALPAFLTLLLLPLLLLPACSTTRAREKADSEVYALVQEKTPAVVGMPQEFTINRLPEWDPLQDVPELAETIEALREAQVSETGAKILTLEHALLIAVNQSRIYQNQKEALFLEGLALTLDRHRYTPIFSGGASARFERDTTATARNSEFTNALRGAREIITELEDITGTPASLLREFANVVENAGRIEGLDSPRVEIDEVQSLRGDLGFGVSRLLAGGGAFALGLTTSALRFLTGDQLETAGTVLTGSFNQPLWAGRGRSIGLERLTQAERDFLYALREYTRFRMNFAVQVCSSYYDVLQRRDALINNYRNYQSFQRNTERERAFAEVGRSTIAQVGRQEQGLLSAQDQWIDSVRRYQEALDAFKILLGLSTDARVVLDDRELEVLREQGLEHPLVSADEAVQVALVARLDLHTAADRTEDARRRTLVAANALKPGIDLVADATTRNFGERDFEDIDLSRTRWNAGLEVDLPLDRKQERNAYRAALIEEERVQRDFTLAEDNIKLELREGWRRLDQARRNYDTALKSVELNRRRVEEQNLLADLGRGSVLDQVDAQNNLTEAENNLTAALVSHNVARLALWRDMGILYIKPNGQWEDIRDDYIYNPPAATPLEPAN
jgi:outer membrane protein TolC